MTKVMKKTKGTNKNLKSKRARQKTKRAMK